jgi:predicted transcriptional regulator
MIDNVIPIDAKWAAKIFAGTKTDEVRSTIPPSYATGIYGIAVSKIPDIVVGRVTIRKHTRLDQDQIKKRRAFTQIPDDILSTYLQQNDTGVCWHLEDVCAFENPVTFYSDGQTTKGAPRNRHQVWVEEQILGAKGWLNPSESDLLHKFNHLKRQQHLNRKERAQHKAELFKAERAAAKQKPAKRCKKSEKKTDEREGDVS